MNVIIREANEKDIPLILAIYTQPDIDNGKVLTTEQALEIFAKTKQYPNYRIYVAVVDNQVVGTFALLIMDNLAHMGSSSGILEDVVVRAEFREKGLGKKMMEFAIGRCRELGCYKVALSSNIKRKSAHAFYESIGFQKHGYSYVVEL